MADIETVLSELSVKTQNEETKLNATASAAEKFFLGDPDKNAAKNKETEANAEMTKAMAALATQMANEPPPKSNTMTWIIVGAAATTVAIVLIVVLSKRGAKQQQVLQPSVSAKHVAHIETPAQVATPSPVQNTQFAEI